MAKAKQSKKHPCHCNQCGYDWQSKKKHPLHCARCISDKWDAPLIGKKLRSAVPSRARLAKGRKEKAVKVKTEKKSAAKASAAPGKARVKNSATDKNDIENLPGAHGVFPKKPRAPRVKKEKDAPVKEQTEDKA
jgi:hypothetical protein